MKHINYKLDNLLEIDTENILIEVFHNHNHILTIYNN